MHYLKEFRTHKDYKKFISQREVFDNGIKVVGYCKREKEVHFYIPEEPPLDLYFWWSGADEPIGGKWRDRIRNAEWNIVGGTWDSENMWYQFLNPTTSQQYADYQGTIPNFGYHWEVNIDCDILYPGNPSNILMDFSSVGLVGGGKAGFNISWYPSSSSWTSNSKLNGNNSASTYKPTNLFDSLEENVWNSRNIRIGVRSSQTINKDEMYINVQNIGETTTSTPFTPLQITPNGCGDIWYIARSFANSGTQDDSNSLSATYYRTSLRIKDIKIYTCRENYEI